MEEIIAGALYEEAKDMDFADYEECMDITIKSIVEDLQKLDKTSVLWNCLERIYG